MSVKRKRVVLSLEDKLCAIRRIDRGETLKTVASDLGVGEVTVGDWRRKREQIEKWVSQRTQSSGGKNVVKNRKTMKNSQSIFTDDNQAYKLSKAQKRKRKEYTDIPKIKQEPKEGVEEEEQVVEEKRVSHSSTHAQTTAPWPEPDACAAYGLVVADRLRQLCPRARAIAQNRIDNLLFELIMQSNNHSDDGHDQTHPVTSTSLQVPGLPYPVKIEEELDENLLYEQDNI